MNKLAVYLLAGLLVSANLRAQADGNKGQIVGAVYDQNQAAIPNAKVRIINQSTGFSRELTTNEFGQYRAVLLDPGTYNIEASSAGFAINRVEGVVLNVGSTVNADLVLRIEETVTTIEVGATLINTALPAPSTTISATAITNLPINGRRFQDFAVLTPTVQVDPQRGQLSFAGQRGIYANIMLDGADYNQPFFGGIRGGERSNSIFTVPQSAIQEFQVVTTGYAAEYGRSTGGILNTVTKSGTNQLHGDAFYLLRHKEMGAKDPVQNIASLETQHQYGASIGGPIMRDRFFFFGAVERQDASQPRQVLFSQLINFTPTAASREAYEFLRSEERPFTQTNDGLAATIRGDYQTNQGHRLTLRYNASDAEAVNAVSVGGALSPFTSRAFSNDGIEKDRTHTGTLQYTHLFSPYLLNDIRLTGTYEERPRLSNSELPQVTAGSPALAIFGARNFLPTTQDDKRWQITDGLSWTRGVHTMKFGVDYSRVTAAQIFGFNQFGAFSIVGSNVETVLDILGTGGSIPNRFDSTAVTYDRQLGNLTASMGLHQFALYAQDSWRLNNKLTLDFGFRWEAQYNPSPEANNSDLINQVRGFTFPNGAQLDPTRINDSTKQFMPRFGFAYSPFSGARRTVVRGHTGLFYGPTPLLVVAGPTNNFRTPPGDVSTRLAPVGNLTVYQQLLAVGIDLNQFPLNSLPVIPVEKVQEASARALGGQPRDPFVGANLIAMASDFRNPRALQAGLGFDTEVVSNLLVGAQFNYVNAVNLLRNRDYNLPMPFLREGDLSLRPNFGLRSGGRRPIPTLGSIWVRESSARSMFRGVTLSAQYRARKLQFGAFYTWSESFSDDDSERDATGFNYMDSFNLRQDYGYARGDIRHQYTSYAVYSLPWGFEISGTFRARSGIPVNPLTGADTNEDFGNNDRAFQAPGVPFPRNSFRNRAVVNNDFRVLKNFYLGKDVTRIQFSAEFFNLLNLDNVVYSGVNGGIFGGTYGLGIDTRGQPVPVDPRFLRLRLPDGSYDRVNAQAGTPLQVQFGLRFFF